MRSRELLDHLRGFGLENRIGVIADQATEVAAPRKAAWLCSAPGLGRQRRPSERGCTRRRKSESMRRFALAVAADPAEGAAVCQGQVSQPLPQCYNQNRMQPRVHAPSFHGCDGNGMGQRYTFRVRGKRRRVCNGRPGRPLSDLRTAAVALQSACMARALKARRKSYLVNQVSAVFSAGADMAGIRRMRRSRFECHQILTYYQRPLYVCRSPLLRAGAVCRDDAKQIVLPQGAEFLHLSRSRDGNRPGVGRPRCTR